MSYIFQARLEKGASKYTTKPDCVAFLEGLPEGEVLELLDHPKVKTASNVPLANAVLVDAVPVTPTPIALMPPSECAFGEVDVQLPDGLKITSKPPDWLAAALEEKSETAAMLVGRQLLYRWPARLGGWLLAKVTKSMNATATVRKDDQIICNFELFYPADGENAEHHLTLKKYARNAKASVDSWVLLE